MKDIKNELIELATREQSSMVSTWTEYLTLSAGDKKKYLIASAGYDLLAEAWEYFNEEKDDYEIPEEINGHKVVGVEDGYIVGGLMMINMDDSGLEFDDPSDPAVLEWLNTYGWSNQVSVSDIEKALI